MSKYQNGKIYKITSEQSDKYYIGSTIQKLCDRLGRHISDYTIYSQGNGKYISSFELIKNDDYKIELIELFPCEDRQELERREGELQLQNIDVIVNKKIAGRTDKEWREENKVEIAKKKKIYKETNKIEISKKQKIYDETNKIEIAKNNKIWCEINKIEIAKKQKIYKETNKIGLAKNKKIYNETNKVHIAEQQKIRNEKNKIELAKKRKIYYEKLKTQRNERIVLPMLDIVPQIDESPPESC